MENSTPSLNPSQKNEWLGYYVPKHTASLFKNSMENNNSPLLPDPNGNVKTIPIINGNTGYILSAKDLIPAILTKEKNDYSSNVVGTKSTIDKAGTQIKKDEKGLFFNFKVGDEFRHAAYFFPEQTADPEKLNNYIASNTKQLQAHQDKVIPINNSDEYLSKYVAACKTGAKLQVSTEVAAEFRAYMTSVCENELKKFSSEKNPEIKSLSSILYDADVQSKDVIKELGMKTERNQPGHNQKREIEQEICF